MHSAMGAVPYALSHGGSPLCTQLLGQSPELQVIMSDQASVDLALSAKSHSAMGAVPYALSYWGSPLCTQLLGQSPELQVIMSDQASVDLALSAKSQLMILQIAWRVERSTRYALSHGGSPLCTQLLGRSPELQVIMSDQACVDLALSAKSHSAMGAVPYALSYWGSPQSCR